MERKRYLELCQQNAINPKSVKVVLDGIEYHPYSYTLYFNEKGKSVHRADLKDVKSNTLVNCPLAQVKEKEF